MKCGLGKCGRCNIGNVYVCKDGPVFTAAQLANCRRSIRERARPGERPSLAASAGSAGFQPAISCRGGTCASRYSVGAMPYYV